jgi:hypothetical protein
VSKKISIRTVVWRVVFATLELLRKTSFANRQPDPAFQALETPVFTSDLCKDYRISQNLCIFSFHYGVQEN